MDKKIKKILEDLYLIDGELKESEVELTAVVRKLLEARPTVEIDKDFVNELKIELLKRADDIKEAAVAQDTMFNLTLKNFSFMLAGASLCAILFVVTDFSGKEFVNKGQKISYNSIDTQVEKLEDEAFGSFSKNKVAITTDDGVSSQGVENEVADYTALSMITESVPVVDLDAKIVAMGGGVSNGESMLASPSRMIMPPQASYSYIYKGSLELPAGKLPVYRRNKNESLGRLLAAKLVDGNLGLSDVSKLENTSIPSLNISEDRDFGYSFNFDFRNSSLSVSTNWEHWPNVYDVCDLSDGDCVEYNKLDISDVPADGELIKIADKFLADYGISKKDFAEPLVDRTWQKQETFSRGSEKYIPERITLTYPLMIEGKRVYNEYGAVEGVTVSVDIRFGRVASVYNVYDKIYSSSKYVVSDNEQKILEVLKRGGNNIRYFDNSAREVEVAVGEPEIALVKMWKPNFGEESRVELFVPCLVFPVEEETADEYLRQENIVVPLIDELINDYSDDGDDVNIEVMPLMRGGDVDSAVLQ